MTRLPHAIFACLFAGLAVFALTGDLVVRDAVQLVAIALMAVQAVRRPDARVAWLLLTVANTSWAIGDLDPERLNACFLVSFGFAQAGLVTLAATQIRSRWLALDGVIAGLTAAAILTAYVSDSLVGLGLRVPATALAGDAMIVTTILLAFAVNGWRPARAWWIIAVGETFLVVNDLTLTNPLAPARTTLLLWAAALVLTSYAVFFPSAPRGQRVGGVVAAAVPVTGGAVCVALLMHAALTGGSPVTVWLAGAALFVGLLRTGFLLRENQRLVRSAREEAVTDKLTGLPNRRALTDDLDAAIAARTPHTLAFFDLDGFKEYNDAFGHAAGDALLQRLAPKLAGVGRAYRLGGDEFCLLTDEAPATARAVTALTEGDITASHGVVAIPGEADTAADALRLADERMYARKRRRRAGQADALMRMLAEHGMDAERAAQLAGEFGRRSLSAASGAR
ncbi:GGDEF domain-containing protein [Solirubrobacter sp. CPCC 204708]|uniref:GGDEF domain-containing protein n=1 Tax=Solirubrobacter deserti TaxID=2282478 RepID=A0ABT4RRD0_9ACTN|nr:GGDEF domain-containing protein [Solirubrobacter deserti]MBE2319274.1 GGDEF domain-containing protein [Solirubrobacter deserti]MDA0141139.1 GGDEF domain-containing protein [Solirubrobacter deserti]